MAIYRANEEPRLEELLSDPIVSLVMARDSLRPEQVWSYIRAAQRFLKLREQPERETAA
ncbi:MAG TPA: hypothetical protein VMU06_19620 [Stellaceae bacterium]|nr:hypothetical protein [Stellaceae bacterium]